MYVVVAAGGLGSRGRRLLFPPTLHVFGAAADLTEAEHVALSLSPAHCHGVHLQNLWVRHKLVHKLLTIHFFNDILYVVVSEGSAEFVIVHIRLVLSNAPEASHLFRLQKLELPIIRRPADHVLVLRLLEELEKELPQSDSTVHSKELKNSSPYSPRRPPFQQYLSQPSRSICQDTYMCVSPGVLEV